MAQASALSLRDLLEDPPVVHRDVRGRRVSWQVGADVLRIIDAHVDETSRTIETGEGVSTVLFAMKGAQHICVSPNEEAIGLIRRYLRDRGVNADRLRFEVGPSERVLPSLEDELAPLDLVLVDGRHGFPAPYIDWHYTAGALRPGGLLIVDDTQIWTCQVLKRFLVEEPGWELVRDLAPRCAVFEKTSERGHALEWTDQPFVVRATKDVAFRWRARRALELLRRGRVLEAGRRAARRLRRP